MPTPLPVSYTHLDVYKRQGLTLVEPDELSTVLRDMGQDPDSGGETLGVYTRRGRRRGIYAAVGLPRLLLLWPMSLGLTWVVAQAIANRPYDRELADLTLALARQASVQTAATGAQTSVHTRALLQRTAESLTRRDDEDHVYYQVLGLSLIHI